jgi:hypothetical protein
VELSVNLTVSGAGPESRSTWKFAGLPDVPDDEPELVRPPGTDADPEKPAADGELPGPYWSLVLEDEKEPCPSVATYALRSGFGG